MLLMLVGQSSLYLQLLRCLVSRDKSGVARMCSVMVEMSSSHLGLYGHVSGRAGRSLCYHHIHHIKNLQFKLLFINSLITQHTSLTETKLYFHLCEYELYMTGATRNYKCITVM
jgi:hypothetical protein